MDNSPHPECSVFVRALPRSVCNTIREMGASRTASPAEVSVADDVSRDVNFRDSEIAFLPLDSWIASVMRHFIDLANTAKWNIPLTELQALQYAVYNVDGHFGWHQDGGEVNSGEAYGADAGSTQPGSTRKVSAVLFLSDGDDYTGGHLELRDYQGTVHTDPRFRQAGTIVVFPANVFHRVTQVRSGIRETLATWALGPAN